LILLHCTSTYPAAAEELNLRVIETLKRTFPVPVGYSGHESSFLPTFAAVMMGANVIERHITLDRAMWGSDQAASLEPAAFERLIKYVRELDVILGDGIMKVYDSELPIIKKLRRK
jgi:N-acetylneuraminate synthase